ncbi:MAG TPA: phosphatidate cytidylyltransferase [Vicinamibacterales bacterium]|nr:phosphatidate cytidylyltransferase [Vicinamibacterales bacterium]HOQ59826.1 phosphatidate cytidylyltransferase [Vicinamibacterales bacterium]HPK71175.1 phosphatidate cytidylyltransferase [Vicinamibacterales bacterium]
MTLSEIGFQALLRWLLFPAAAIPVCVYARVHGHHGFLERLGPWFLIIPVALGASYLGMVPFGLLLAMCGAVAAWELARLGQALPAPRSGAAAVLGARPSRFALALACVLPWILWPALGPSDSAIVAGAAVLLPVLLFFALPRAAAAVWTVPLLPLSLGAALSFWVRLQQMPAGFRWVLVAFSVVVVNDVMGFVTGRLLPGPRPFPSLSPGKTITGYAGGLAGAVLTAFVLAFAEPEFGALTIAAAAVALACSGAAGDLLASAVKRRHQAKDFGRALGAQGGMLDRLDSLLGAGWIFYLFVTLIAR